MSQPPTAGRVLLSHPTLNSNVRQAALALAEGDLLAELHTSIAIGPRTRRLSAASPKAAQLLNRRTVPAEIDHRTHSHPAYELRRLIARRAPAARRALGSPSLHGMYADLDRITARRVRGDLGAVLAYEDGAEATFAAAHRLGLPRLYDLPIPFWREVHRVLAEEADANPAWAPVLGALSDPQSVLDRKMVELEAADIVFCASPLSASSVLAEIPTKRVVTVPYGCPPPTAAIRPSEGGPIRALYVGSLTQRKGLSYLFDAMASLGPAATLTVVGSGPPQETALLKAALATHEHLPVVPHQQMAQVMRGHDVLVLPSLIEGFGLVITEALAQGLPVLATDRTGAATLFTSDESLRWIVPPASSDGIAERLEAWAHDTDALNEAKSTALAIAREHPWSDYRARMRTAVRESIH